MDCRHHDFLRLLAHLYIPITNHSSNRSYHRIFLFSVYNRTVDRLFTTILGSGLLDILYSEPFRYRSKRCWSRGKGRRSPRIVSRVNIVYETLIDDVTLSDEKFSSKKNEEKVK